MPLYGFLEDYGHIIGKKGKAFLQPARAHAIGEFVIVS